jgi:hypothetical protein
MEGFTSNDSRLLELIDVDEKFNKTIGNYL